MAIEQDQTPYKGNERSAWQNKKFVSPEKQDPIAPLDSDWVKAQQDAEAAKQGERDAERELHNRVTAGEDPANATASQ